LRQPSYEVSAKVIHELVASLHGGQNPTTTGSGGTTSINELCDLCLPYQHARGPRGRAESQTPQRSDPELGHLVSFLGQGRKIRSISTLDLPSYKRRLSWDNMALPIDWIFTSV
jgi:hypothetical protein